MNHQGLRWNMHCVESIGLRKLLNLYKRGFKIQDLFFFGAKLWNSLPLDTKQITPFSRFRQNVKNSMIDRYSKDTDN